MNLPITVSRLVEHCSDERDVFGVVNQMRDGVINKQVNAWPVVVKTTDATVTRVWQDDMPADSVGDFWVRVVAATAGAADVAGYIRRAAFRRQGTSAVTIVGATDVIGVDKETDASWDVVFALDATTPGTVYVTVTGAVAKTVSWRVNVIAMVYPWS